VLLQQAVQSATDLEQAASKLLISALDIAVDDGDGRNEVCQELAVIE
jgi:ribosomal protein S11